MFRINVLKTFCLVYILTFIVGLSAEENLCGRILHLVGTSTDVAGSAEELTRFFDRNSHLTGDELLSKLEAATAGSKTSILSTLLGTTNLGRVTDAYDVMLNSVSDLKNMIMTFDGPLEGSYKQYFIDGYRVSQVSTHIRFLPDLPTYTLPDLNIPLLQQLKRKTQCDHDAISAFGDFYLNLLSNGIALQAVYILSTSNASLNTILNTEWEANLQNVQTEFGVLELRCFSGLYNQLNNSETSRLRCDASLQKATRNLEVSEETREQLDASLKAQQRELQFIKEAYGELESSMAEATTKLENEKEARMQLEASLDDVTTELEAVQETRVQLEESLEQATRKLNEATQSQEKDSSGAEYKGSSLFSLSLTLFLYVCFS